MTRREARNMDRMNTVNRLMDERAGYVAALAAGTGDAHKLTHYVEQIEGRIEELASH